MVERSMSISASARRQSTRQNPNPDLATVMQELQEQESLTKLEKPSSSLKASRRVARPESTDSSGSEFKHAQYRSPLFDLAKMRKIWFGDRGAAFQADVTANDEACIRRIQVCTGIMGPTIRLTGVNLTGVFLWQKFIRARFSRRYSLDRQVLYFTSEIVVLI